MKKRFLSAVLAASLLFGSAPMTAHAADTRTYAGAVETVKLSSTGDLARETNFNSDWKFQLTDANSYSVGTNDSSWSTVSLPHDFSIKQNFTTSGQAESGFLPGGTGWYRKHFTLPASAAGQKLVLNFDGVYKNATVYVNDTNVGEHRYGYTSFAVDITKYVTCDGMTDNVIAVKAVNTIPSSRWYSGSGIYRDVTLIATDPIHAAYNGISITTPNIASGSGTVQVKAEIDNDGSAAATATVTAKVYAKGSSAVLATASTNVSVGAGSSATATVSPVVSSPKLWSIDNPNLYTVRTEITSNGTVTDTVETDFGFRYFSFDNSGFHLNGQNIKLNGVCMHHDQGALGSAAYYDAMYRQLSIMKEMGANAIRTSHNPMDEDFIDICNELGLLVMVDFFDGWTCPKNGNAADFAADFQSAVDTKLVGAESGMTCAEFALKSNIRRDFNDPSIIIWSIGNEVQQDTVTSISAFPTIAQNLVNWVQETDSTRYISIGSNEKTTSGTMGSVHAKVDAATKGIVGFNYAEATDLNNLHAAYGPILSAETSSATNSRSRYQAKTNNAAVDGAYHLTSYDTSTVGWGKTAHDSIWDTMARDYVAGEFVWTGFDYIGEPTPWNGTGYGTVTGSSTPVPNSSYFGIAETTGFEKDTYYLYRSQWKQDDTTLHLVTAWDADNMMSESGKTPVWIYSNAPVVKLYRNNTHIGTATRTVNKTAAGHEYYTYTTQSANTNLCTTESGSGADSLYAVFNVAYEAGNITARAFQADGTTEITNTTGKSAVYTPGTVSKLKLERSDSSIAADGSSLVYIAVDVQDANGVLDTTASNNITFSLTGNGEIVGVDNGDQATTRKYQQASVLTSATSANINAYAGKALVIVRSTKEASSITLTASASGLTGGSVSVTTTEVEDDTVESGLISYSMVRDYSVMQGTNPVLQTSATGKLADGSTINGTIAWNAVTAYNTLGSHALSGTLTFPGYTPIAVSGTLRVIPDVIAMRNISTVTKLNTVPTLPDTVNGVKADGTVMTAAQNGAFSVKWNTMKASDFNTVDQIVVVNGTATVIGNKTLPVTASIRVGTEVNTTSTNLALDSTIEISQSVPNDYWSDNLNSVNNGVTDPGDNTAERWTNWKYRKISDSAALTFQWVTAKLIQSVNLYYYYDNCCAYPQSIQFEYSPNGTDYSTVNATVAKISNLKNGEAYSYTFDQVINPVYLRIKLTQQSGTTGNNCVGLTEVQIMSFEGALTYNTSADLSGISVDGTPVDAFAANTLAYEAFGTASSAVTATTAQNAGITVLPIYQGVIRVLTIAENGAAAKTYAITLTNAPACAHPTTEVRNAVAATCTTTGYTGDTYCTNADCGVLVTAGSVIPALNHPTAQLINKTPATCTANGYSGDTYCSTCDTTLQTGTVTPRTGHAWDSGVASGDLTIFTCGTCGTTKSINNESDSLTVDLSAKRGTGGRILLTGEFASYLNEDSLGVVGHGLIYMRTDRLNDDLTLQTTGRTRVNISKYDAGGTFTYSLYPTTKSTEYTVRAFLVCESLNGYSYIYSDPIKITYNGLS